MDKSILFETCKKNNVSLPWRVILSQPADGNTDEIASKLSLGIAGKKNPYLYERKNRKTHFIDFWGI